MALLTAQQRMGAAALILAASTILSRLMGLARDKIISWQFGAGGESDMYFAAFVVPDIINYLLAGGFMSITIIPLLTRRFQEDEADAWSFFSCVFCWMAAASTPADHWRHGSCAVAGADGGPRLYAGTVAEAGLFHAHYPARPDILFVRGVRDGPAVHAAAVPGSGAGPADLQRGHHCRGSAAALAGNHANGAKLPAPVDAGPHGRHDGLLCGRYPGRGPWHICAAPAGGGATGAAAAHGLAASSHGQIFAHGPAPHAGADHHDAGRAVFAGVRQSGGRRRGEPAQLRTAHNTGSRGAGGSGGGRGLVSLFGVTAGTGRNRPLQTPPCARPCGPAWP